jgi:hypothetical protein
MCQTFGTIWRVGILSRMGHLKSESRVHFKRRIGVIFWVSLGCLNKFSSIRYQSGCAKDRSRRETTATVLLCSQMID